MCWHHPKKKAKSTFGHFHIATAFHFAHKSVPPKVASGEKHFCICICFQTFSTFTLQLHKFLYLYLLLNFWPLSHRYCISFCICICFQTFCTFTLLLHSTLKAVGSKVEELRAAIYCFAKDKNPPLEICT